MFFWAQVPRCCWTPDLDPRGTSSDRDRGQQRDLNLLMEPVWSPDMQCAVQHTHWGLGWNLALIHTEDPSGRIPSSVVPSSVEFPSSSRGMHKRIKLSKSQMMKMPHLICLFSEGRARSNKCVYLTFFQNEKWWQSVKAGTCPPKIKGPFFH